MRQNDAAVDGRQPRPDRAVANTVKLTERKIESLATPTGRERITWDTVVRGLGVRTTPRGVKSWLVMDRIASPVRGDRQEQFQLTLGRYPVVSLAEARDRARKAIDMASRGQDPRNGKQRGQPGDSFGDLWALYLKDHLQPYRRPKTLKVAKQTMKEPLALWGHRPATAITKTDIIGLHDRIAGRDAVVQADHALAMVRTTFRYGIGRGKVMVDPTEGIRKRSQNAPRERVLDDRELVEFWRATAELPWPYQPIFRLLLLTGARKDEVAGMKWSELNLDQRTWSLPGGLQGRVKNRRAHTVHLSDEAMSIIAGLPRVSDTLVFTTDGKSASTYLHRAKERLIAPMRQRLPEMTPWTTHDLRRTMATKMAELGIAPHVVDKILNHVSGQIRGVALVYNRHAYLDERKAALDAWSAHVAGLVHVPTKVVRPRR